MAALHCIEKVDVHSTFNDAKRPWGPLRLGQVVPDCIVVFQPVDPATAIQLTTKYIRAKLKACKSSVIYDCKHKTFLVLVANKKAVRTVIKNANNVPGYKIFAFDGDYEYCGETSGRIKDWIVEQANGDGAEGDVPGPAPKVVPEGEQEDLINPSNEGPNDLLAVHVNNTSPEPEVFTPHATPLAGLDGLIPLGDDGLNDLPDLETKSTPSDEEDNGGLQGSNAPFTPKAILPIIDLACVRHNQEIHSILHTLVRTGPTEIRQRSNLHQLLEGPIVTNAYDVEMEEALWHAMLDSKKIQRDTGDKSLLVETIGALVTAWQNLELGPLPDILKDK
ncbi:hypothetical protein FRC00_003016 [Tulasnella sp. 408]|nr:hypothetical protein FRC00_003016 [Tulasnella sp. 408]